MTLKPSAPVAARMARQSLGRSDAVCAARASGSSVRSAWCSLGTSRTWPRITGWISRKAIAASVSRTLAAGISPRTILQKRQLTSCGWANDVTAIVAPLDPLCLPSPSSAAHRSRSRPGGDDGGLGRGLDLLGLAQEGDHAHGGGVPLADLGELVDPGVAAVAAPEARADLVEEAVGHLFLGDDGQDAAEVVQVPAVLGQRDQLLG